jgi:hypothetical protein
MAVCNSVLARMKHYATILMLSGLSLPALAQSYDLAFGMRLGTDIGASAQFRLPLIDENFTLEPILFSSLQREEVTVALLGEQHFPLIIRNVNVYAGAGVHKGFNTSGDDKADYEDPFGVSAVFGGEVTLGRFNVSYDFKPAINLTGGEKTVYTQTGISLRYVVSKRFDIWEKPAQKRKRQRQKEREKRKNEKEKNGDTGFKFPWEKD